MIYLLFRSETLLMFRWCEFLHIQHSIDNLRPAYSLSEWIIYSFPDGLWVLSYILFMGTIWKYDLRKGKVFLLILPTIAIISEIMQGLGLLRGTFDMVDVWCYIFATLTGLFIIYLINKDLYANEKNSVKVIISMATLSFYLFMAVGSDESSDSNSTYRDTEPTYSPQPEYQAPQPTPSEPIFDNGTIEEEADTLLMRDSFDNNVIED